VKNYYKILGIKKTATEDEIKRVYRKLALEYHPDRHGGDDTQFKEVSEAYAVLRDSAKRAEHDLDLKQEELKQKPRKAPTHQTTTSADFGGKADPSSQQGVWDDVQSNDQAGYRYRYSAASTPSQLKNAGRWIRPLSVTLIGMAVVIVVGSYIIRSLSGSGGAPTISPLTQNNNNNAQNYTPPTTDGGGYTTPTPSATPTCPTGQPSINIPGSPTDTGTTDDQNRELYLVSGTLTNDTSATINVNNVGFYDYTGTYDRNAPPDDKVPFANMVENGSLPIPPGVTVNWSTNLPLTGSKVAATLEYPPGVGDQLTPEWYYTGNVSQNCQPSPVSAQ
jgi:DnaJ domain